MNSVSKRATASGSSLKASGLRYGRCVQAQHYAKNAAFGYSMGASRFLSKKPTGSSAPPASAETNTMQAAGDGESVLRYFGFDCDVLRPSSVSRAEHRDFFALQKRRSILRSPQPRRNLCFTHWA